MSNGRLLIVESDSSILASYTDSLTSAGFEVAQAPTAAAALHRIEKDRFEAILSDRLTLLRRLRIHAPDVPVILMLANPDNSAAIRARGRRAARARMLLY